MSELAAAVDQFAVDSQWSGVVRVDRGGAVELAAAYGAAQRAYGVHNEVHTQFGIASGTKGLTALTVMSLVDEGRLTLATPARALLGDDLPLIDDAVTVAHLLEHRSGIGDYIDEDSGLDVHELHLPVPVHSLVQTDDYLRVLDGHPAKFAPGAQFSYCNSGYVVLALLAERAGELPFAQLVHERVCVPAGMHDTAFLRSDELPARAAVGYLHTDGLRSNVLHLPVCGSGDGGIYSTVADIRALWQALFAGRIVAPATVADMVRAHSEVPSEGMRYGRGFWLQMTRDIVFLEGMDAGVSFRSVHDPAADLTYTVIANSTDGAWPMLRLIAERVV